MQPLAGAALATGGGVDDAAAFGLVNTKGHQGGGECDQKCGYAADDTEKSGWVAKDHEGDEGGEEFAGDEQLGKPPAALHLHGVAEAAEDKKPQSDHENNDNPEERIGNEFGANLGIFD